MLRRIRFQSPACSLLIFMISLGQASGKIKSVLHPEVKESPLRIYMRGAVAIGVTALMGMAAAACVAGGDDHGHNDAGHGRDAGAPPNETTNQTNHPPVINNVSQMNDRIPSGWSYNPRCEAGGRIVAHDDDNDTLAYFISEMNPLGIASKAVVDQVVWDITGNDQNNWTDWSGYSEVEQEYGKYTINSTTGLFPVCRWSFLI